MILFAFPKGGGTWDLASIPCSGNSTEFHECIMALVPDLVLDLQERGSLASLAPATELSIRRSYRIEPQSNCGGTKDSTTVVLVLDTDWRDNPL